MIKKFKKEFKNFIKEGLKSQQGMSLIEILIALTLLGLAATFITGKVLENLEEGRRSAATVQMANIAGQLKQFNRYCNRYPNTDEGLDALIEKPAGKCKRYPENGFLDGTKVPEDPWGNEYIYRLESANKFFLATQGKAGEEAEEDEYIVYGQQK